MFTFFETDGLVGSDFRTVYNLYMRIEALSKALTFFDMRNVFQIVPELTVAQIRAQLQHLFRCQQDISSTSTTLLADATNPVLLDAKTAAETAEQVASIDLDAINIKALDLLTSFETIDTATIRQLNRYYAEFRETYTVENLAWSSERILATCDNELRDKVREQLVGVSPLENGGPLVLKMMLDIVMNVDDAVLQSLVQSIQSLRMKEIAGENVGTVVSYLKGAVMLLQNCTVLPMDLVGLLNDIMLSAENNDFTSFMKSVYFDHKRKMRVIGFTKYLNLAEAEYRNLYRAGKWSVSKNDPSSGLFVEHDEESSNNDDGYHCGGRTGRGGSGRGGYGRGGCGRGYGRGRRSNGAGRHATLDCHNCGKRGHVARNCRRPGSGAFDDNANGDDDFPGNDGEALECGAWGTHLRVDHDTQSSANISATNTVVAVPTEEEVAQAANIAEVGDHSTAEIQTAFARLRAAGIL